MAADQSRKRRRGESKGPAIPERTIDDLGRVSQELAHYLEPDIYDEVSEEGAFRMAELPTIPHYSSKTQEKDQAKTAITESIVFEPRPYEIPAGRISAEEIATIADQQLPSRYVLPSDHQQEVDDKGEEVPWYEQTADDMVYVYHERAEEYRHAHRIGFRKVFQIEVSSDDDDDDSGPDDNINSKSESDSDDEQAPRPYAARARDIAKEIADAYTKNTQSDGTRRTDFGKYRWSEGRRRWEKACALVDELEQLIIFPTGPARFDIQQRRFIQLFLEACACHIYAEDWLNEKLNHLQRLELKRYNQWQLVVAPRRFGKTIALAVATAIIMIVCPAIEIRIFAQKAEMSEIIKQHVVAYARHLIDKKRIARDIRDRFVLCREDQVDTLTAAEKAKLDLGQRSCLIALPDGNNRGTGGQLVIMEEASSIKGGNIEAIITPLLSVKDSVLFAISTAGYRDNQYNKMVLMKHPDGSPVFQVELVVNYCTRCFNIGRVSQCRHMEILLPAWKDAATQAMQRMVSNKGVHETENMGLLQQYATACFLPSHINYWLDCRTVSIEPRHDPRYIFVAIDPSRGSKSTSELAIIAGVRTHDRGFCVSGRFLFFLDLVVDGVACCCCCCNNNKESSNNGTRIGVQP